VTPPPLRVGVIGCGALARAVHIPLLRKMAGVELAALADNHPKVLKQAAGDMLPTRQFSDGIALIKSGTVDAVVIATPASSHSWFTVAAFERGLSVYLEKPIATDIPDGLAIVEAWKKSGRTGMAGFNYRFNPLYARLREEMSAHKIIATDSVFRIPRTRDMGWRTERSSGGGALLDLASHQIDLTRFITRDELSEVSAVLRSHHSEHDSATLECLTRNGINCRIKAEYADTFEHTYKVITSGSSFSIDLARSHKVERSSRPGRLPSPARLLHIYRKFRSPAFEPSYEPALRAFVDAARRNTQVSPDMRDGLIALQVTSAAEESASSGSPVAIPSA